MNRVNFTLSPAQRRDARTALQLLGESGLTLEQAARVALGQRQASSPRKVADAADEFLRTRLGDGRRPATFVWYEERLGVIVAAWGERIMGTITRAEWRAWMAGSSAGEASKAATQRAARALWNWGMKQEPPIATENVTVGAVFKAASKDGGIRSKVLSVKACESILAQIAPEHRPAVALMMFAGVRPEEVAGDDGKPWLPWSAVRPAEKILRIEAEFAKTGTPRVLETLPPSLWRHVGEPRGDSETIATVSRRSLVDACKRAGKLTQWPQDALRHTFASYALAAYEDAGKVAYWLGHEGKPTLLYNTYRGVVSRADAEKFWAL